MAGPTEPWLQIIVFLHPYPSVHEYKIKNNGSYIKNGNVAEINDQRQWNIAVGIYHVSIDECTCSLCNTASELI